MAEQWLSIVEYARTFAVSDMTVRRRIKTGRLHAVLREGKYYIPVTGELVAGDELISKELPPVMPARVPVSAQPVAAEFPVIEAPRTGASHRGLPSQIATNIQRFESSLVDSQALLQFCEHSVTRINSIERHLQDSFQAKIHSLEAELRLKDQTIGQLKEQVEDLQILVKLMEKPFKAGPRA